MTEVSVIIPAEKENENLKKCLEALGKQSYKNFEVLVIISKSLTSLKLPKYIQEINYNGSPSGKRNFGVGKARGAILAFLDDDCIADKDWIKVGIKSLKLFKAVGGAMKTPKNSSFWERASGYLAESVIINPINLRKEKTFVDDWPSANFFIKKSDFLKLGGFDSRFWPGEDTKLCLDIVRRGGKILYDPGVIVYHRRRPLFRQYLEQVARYGRQRGKFARIFPQTSRRWYYFLPSGFVLYLMFLFVLLVKLDKLGLMPLILYSIVVIVESGRTAWRDRNILIGFMFVVGAFLTHVVYGISFIRGIIK